MICDGRVPPVDLFSGSTMRSVRSFLTAAALVATLGAYAGPAFAEAEGPDMFRVVGIAPGHSLVLRTGPGLLYPVAGALPHNATGVRNLGCKGGLTYAEWLRASARERTASVEKRWCRVRRSGVTGWARVKYLREEAGEHPR